MIKDAVDIKEATKKAKTVRQFWDKLKKTSSKSKVMMGVTAGIDGVSAYIETDNFEYAVFSAGYSFGASWIAGKAAAGSASIIAGSLATAGVATGGIAIVAIFVFALTYMTLDWIFELIKDDVWEMGV